MDVYTEAVEVCPYCDTENIYLNYNADSQGYIAICDNCGLAIFLCDECLHAEDNPGRKCDWKDFGTFRECFRRKIKNRKED